MPTSQKTLSRAPRAVPKGFRSLRRVRHKAIESMGFLRVMAKTTAWCRGLGCRLQTMHLESSSAFNRALLEAVPEGSSHFWRGILWSSNKALFVVSTVLGRLGFILPFDKGIYGLCSLQNQN